jgi:hypothetical protein
MDGASAPQLAELRVAGCYFWDEARGVGRCAEAIKANFQWPRDNAPGSLATLSFSG